ncbi:acyl-CoA dehydrogenase family protein [Pacificimonas sp. WHA3]|uniref:Acyl-CoA dehydrogenase family protein n=1 Tax=Pacificimonas pallii TaxID=2827236 RepID=A0ABS6SG49_9SPHN|nr:acyl-CoA dehydrogenase family protein [Pacificimonas pallii]MBV7257398.1 acyl-CoA dehydrogenase family protein [Pacificimonas pallii]
MTTSPKELAEFAADADAWFSENVPDDPGFLLPLTFMEVGEDRQFDFLRDWQRKVYEAGYLGAAWPAEYGGGGLSDALQKVATKAMKAHRAPILLNAIGLNWAGPLILDTGTEAQKRAYLKGILSAEDIWCQGFSEPENGSDLGNAQLKAERDDDGFVLNGSKIWTTQGNYAKYMILLARTNPDAETKYAGLSFFLAPMTVPGISTRKLQKLTGEYGFTQTFFEDARIPADSLIGGEGNGWKVAMRTLEYERGARGGQAGGYVSVAPDMMGVIDIARQAKRDGKTAMDDPVLQDRLIGHIMDMHALSLSNDRKRLPALTSDHPMSLPTMSKLEFTELFREISEFALTLLGSKSAYYIDEPNAADGGWWARSYLNAFSATIGGGTSQIQRNIIGEHVLGLPKTR